MSATNLVLIVASVLLAGLFFYPKVLRSRAWKATVTPLASIIGSGFLVAGPILSHAAGTLAWLAMLGLCGVGYLFGAAIRHNILHIEPLLGHQPPRLVAALERASELILLLAYFISVTYYLNLFAAFGVRIDNIIDPFWVRCTATGVIIFLGIVGLRGGLSALERLELAGVGLRTAVIGGLLAALILANILAIHAGTFTWPHTAHLRGLDEVQILLGLVILVQGFETSRYLGEEYDAKTRIKTMIWAQAIATAIYVPFILLITPYFTGKLPVHGGATEIVTMLKPVATLAAPMIILIALTSQFSAAVADMNGAGGLVEEGSGYRLKTSTGNLITAVAAIAITWLANIYEIITYASKVFVIYYALQSLQAALSAYRLGRRWQAAMFLAAVGIALVVVIFAEPAQA